MDSSLERYKSFIARPENEWNLFEYGLLLGQMIHPGEDLATYRIYVGELADEVRSARGRDDDIYSTVEAMNAVLFLKERFRGNSENYYDARNSYLTEVLASRRGIPITLSLLYAEIGRRLGARFDYVGMPGHFLLKIRTGPGDLYLDAFSQGRLMLPDECLALMEEICGGQIETRSEHLAVARPREVALRMLMNLKQIYRLNGRTTLLVKVLERRIPLLDDPLPEILERGLAKVTIENYAGAVEDIEHFLAHSDQEEIKELIQEQLNQIRKLARAN